MGANLRLTVLCEGPAPSCDWWARWEVIRLLQAHAAWNNITRRGKKKKLDCCSNFRFMGYYCFWGSLSFFSVSPHFSGLLCTIRRARGRAGGGGNRRRQSCQLLWAASLFPLLLLFFTKTDCGLFLIRFPRGLPSSKRGNKPGRLWNKAGRRNRRTGRMSLSARRGKPHSFILGLSVWNLFALCLRAFAGSLHGLCNDGQADTYPRDPVLYHHLCP